MKPLLVPKTKLAKRLYTYLGAVANKYPGKFVAKEHLVEMIKTAGFQWEKIQEAFEELDSVSDIAKIYEDSKTKYRLVAEIDHETKLALYRQAQWFDALPDKPVVEKTPFIAPTVYPTNKPPVEVVLNRIEKQVLAQEVNAVKSGIEVETMLAPTVYAIEKEEEVAHQKRKKKKMYKDQNGLCKYCVQPFPIEKLTFDHVVPRMRGGSTSIANLVLACMPCNNKKGHLMPDEWERVLNGGDKKVA